MAMVPQKVKHTAGNILVLAVAIGIGVAVMVPLVGAAYGWVKGKFTKQPAS